MNDIPPKIQAMIELEKAGRLNEKGQFILKRAREGGLIPAMNHQPSTMDSLKEAGGNAVDWAKNVWTGDDRREFDYPELPDRIRNKVVPPKPTGEKMLGLFPYTEGGGRVGSKMSLARGDVGKLNIFNKMAGNRKSGIDKHGNVFVDIEGENYYLNRPGASKQDIDDILTTGAIEAFAARFGGKAGKAAMGTAGRVVGTGLGLSAGSAGQDLMAKSAGSKQGIDPTMALIAGALGAGGEALAPILGPWFRKWFRKGGEYVDEAGNLSDAGRSAVNRAGLNPDDVSQDFINEMNRLANQSVDPMEAVASAKAKEARGLGVDLTKGDITGDVNIQSREIAMEAGARGDQARDVMTGFRQRQKDQLMDARGTTLDDMGGPRVNEPGQGAASVRDKITHERKTAKGAVKEAYDTAKEGRAYLSKDGLTQFHKSVQKELEREFGTEINSMPGISDRLKELKNWTGNKSLKGISVKTLDEYRKRIGRAVSKMADQPQDAALIQMKQSMDRYLDDVVDTALMTGDDATLQQFRKARALHKEFKQKFDGDALVDKIMKPGRDGVDMDPRDAANIIYGAGILGNKAGVTNSLRKIKSIVGEESAEWQAMRQEGFFRMFPDDVKNLTGFKKAFDTAMGKNPEYMRELFGDRLQDLKKLRRVVGYATDKNPLAGNPSKTGYEVARAIKDTFGPLGQGVAVFVARFGGPFKDISEGMAARAATIPKLSPKPVPGVGMWGVGTAGASEQYHRAND